MNKKTRDKLKKVFGLGYHFNTKIKLPLSDVVIASWVMGDMNSERFWNYILKERKERKETNGS